MTVQSSLTLDHRRSSPWTRAYVRRTPSPGSGRCSRPGVRCSRRTTPRNGRTGAYRGCCHRCQKLRTRYAPRAPGTKLRARHARRSTPTGCTWRGPWCNRPRCTRDRDRSRSPALALPVGSTGPTRDPGNTTSGRHQTPRADVARSHFVVSYACVRGDVSWGEAASSGAKVSCAECTRTATKRNGGTDCRASLGRDDDVSVDGVGLSSAVRGYVRGPRPLIGGRSVRAACGKEVGVQEFSRLAYRSLRPARRTWLT